MTVPYLTRSAGVNSTARKVVQGGVDYPPQRTGFAAYRAVVDIERMCADPEVLHLLNRPSFNLWCVSPQYSSELILTWIQAR